jgi:glycerol uptake facilitator-like aquaporin
MKEGTLISPQRLMAEALGTAFLLAAVVGSGIMAAKLAGGNGALALLCNTLPTGAILTVLILTFGPVSGAHFNPAVSIAFALRRELPWPEAAAYIVVQIIGGIIGVWAAHAMFELPLWQVSLAVGLYITAAYWFTASTSFANPAVTIARALSDTYAGIAPAGIAAFIAAQIVGALLAVALARWLFAR